MEVQKIFFLAERLCGDAQGVRLQAKEAVGVVVSDRGSRGEDGRVGGLELSPG